MWFSKFLDFFALELADVGYECIFTEVHLFITVENEAIGIYSEEILGGEVELYVVEGVGFEDGFGGGDILIVIFVFAAEMSHVIFTKNKRSFSSRVII